MKMESIEDRISKLKSLGAGDDQCRECLKLSMGNMATCKKCIASSPEFSRLVSDLIDKK